VRGWREPVFLCLLAKMGKQDGAGDGGSPAFVLWKPTLMCKVRKALLSDSFAVSLLDSIGLNFMIKNLTCIHTVPVRHPIRLHN
jgi:hypothetical protein